MSLECLFVVAKHYAERLFLPGWKLIAMCLNQGEARREFRGQRTWATP
jgi:hypothetical protein